MLLKKSKSMVPILSKYSMELRSTGLKYEDFIVPAEKVANKSLKQLSWG